MDEFRTRSCQIPQVKEMETTGICWGGDGGYPPFSF